MEKSNSYDLVIKGNIVLWDKILYDSYLAVKGEKIAGIFSNGENVNGKEIIDRSGNYIIPGAIDAHVHCYSSLDEGISNATNAAACGGVTTIIEMPYDADGMICTKDLFIKKRNKIEKEARVDVAMLATIKDNEEGLKEIKSITDEGACGFKMSMFNTNSARFPRINEGLMFDAFCKISSTGCPVGLHAENDDIVRSFMKKYEEKGESDQKAHCYSRPKVSESSAVAAAAELALFSKVKLHIYHGSFPRIFNIVNYYKALGVRVTAETCPHYLCFSEKDMDELKAKGKINPPLREEEDKEALWKQISMGFIDMVTSDHAPWTLDKKSEKNIFKNSSGAPGVETLLPIMYSEGVAKGRITMLQLVNLISKRPAEVFGLDYCKGSLAVGMDADFVILDPNENYILDERELHSTALWSPYNGFKIQGKVTHTFVRGSCVYNNGELNNNIHGKFIKGIPSSK
ncbi:dihydroorotase family protein [Clostridium sp. DJ247]|uniref:dihydroorotase n=1 Tax=Clostridium sp. DJ247 TaxID=2726188 RepID=UPI001625F847|nr:dihydroorotase family protein [Clostridium sp. DJ247]MBC2582634.1 dihydroorotase family protein [Clostridium sp. DJ247]